MKLDYPVHSFKGRKRVILSTISWMGGKNPFLGIAYFTVGSVCFFLGIILLIIHHKCGNRSNRADISNWELPTASAAFQLPAAICVILHPKVFSRVSDLTMSECFPKQTGKLPRICSQSWQIFLCAVVSHDHKWSRSSCSGLKTENILSVATLAAQVNEIT